MRGGLIAAAGLSLLVATMGVPLPVARTKDRSIPFPCMDRSCGCHDAAGCKARCCCFSSEEKLAWAAENHVDPTPFVDDAALVCLAAAARHETATPGCCDKKAASCCSGDAKRHADDHTMADAGFPPQTSNRQRNANPSDGLVTIVAYRQCTGLQPLWTLLNAALPPPEQVRCKVEFLLTGRVAEECRTLTAVYFSPATPPPRA